MRGIDATTGKYLDDLAHLRQSIRDILTTRIGTRVQRRDYGSRLPELIDSPFTEARAIEFYGATAEALDQWEPRIQVGVFRPPPRNAGIRNFRNEWLCTQCRG